MTDQAHGVNTGIGTVSHYNDIIGSGIITPDDGTGKINVSYRSIKKTGYKILNEGQRVSYELQKTENGLQRTAVHVTPH
jgi:cold shock protein